MSAHTPGPWVSVHTHPNPDVRAKIAYIEGGRHRRPLEIATVYRCDSDAEQEANARLIAAAPELLAVARKALDAWTGDGPPIDLDELRAAIAKAGAA